MKSGALDDDPRAEIKEEGKELRGALGPAQEGAAVEGGGLRAGFGPRRGK